MKLFGLMLCAALVGGAASNGAFLIRNADVYPVTGPEMKGVSVLIENGKIADIGPKVVAPKGVPVVEAKGLRVYPGMIDSSTALGLSEVESVRETVDTGELGEFMPQLRALASINPASEHFPVVRANGITSVMTFPALGGGGGRGGSGARQFISGAAALIHTDGWTWEEMSIKGNAAVHLVFPSLGRGGRGFGGEMPGIPETPAETGVTGAASQARRTYDEQIATINRFFEDARNYQKAKAAKSLDFRTDLKYEAMLPVLEGKIPLAVSASRATAIHDAVQFAEKQRIKIVILQPRDLAKAAAELKEKNIPVILGKVLALPQNEDDPYDASYTLPAEAYKAGVKFAFGSFDNQFARNLPYQAATAVAFGLPYEEALKAVTINAAQIWGVADQVGSIEKGKWADLLITNGDPLETQTEIQRMYIKGQEVDLSSRHTKLYEKYVKRP